MAIIKVEIRRGAYYDSVILMQLQRSLAQLPGVADAGVVMGTVTNKEVLAQSGLLVPEVESAKAEDLVIVISGKDEASAVAALGKVDELVMSRRRTESSQDYRPHSIETAVKMLPEANWVLVSVPGRYAAQVARQALSFNKNVFLYSDNVSLDDELQLKNQSTQKGLLVMGPDCGTAIINGIGLGFANKVRKGPIGVVAASGTGLQQVTVRIHQMGGGITHAIGTGGRDLSEAVNAATARQGLDLLARDPQTRVIVLVSKPPSPKVAQALITAARAIPKPVVVNFIGFASASRRVDNIFFATTFDETAEMAIKLIDSAEDFTSKPDLSRFKPGQRYLRGLFSGGTLQYEALLILKDYLPVVFSNAPLDKKKKLADSLVSQENTIIDLGEDEFTVGRLHPMMDNDLRIRRLEKEAADQQVAAILLDVVLGYGAHPDPASELAPAIQKAIQIARQAGRSLEIVAVVSGTDEDPQDMHKQMDLLKEAGAKVYVSNDAAVRDLGKLIQALNPIPGEEAGPSLEADLGAITQAMAGINLGLESFTESLVAQGAQAVQVDWKPSAGSNEKLMGILERMRQKQDQ